MVENTVPTKSCLTLINANIIPVARDARVLGEKRICNPLKCVARASVVFLPSSPPMQQQQQQKAAALVHSAVRAARVVLYDRHMTASVRYGAQTPAEPARREAAR